MTETDIYRAVKDFVHTFCGVANGSIIRGWNNRVPSPKPPFVVMSIIDSVRLTTDTHDYHYLGGDRLDDNVDVGQGVQCRVQLDCYGEGSYDVASKISVFALDFEGIRKFKTYGLSPLYASNPQDLPFVTGESMYEARWMVEIFLNFDAVHRRQQDFFIVAVPNKIHTLS